MITLWVHNWPQGVNQVLVGEKALSLIEDKTEFLNADRGARWDSETNTLEIKFSWQKDAMVSVQ